MWRIGLIAFAALLLGLPANAQQVTADSRAQMPRTHLFMRPLSPCEEPRVELSPERGGRTRIAIDTPCRPQQLTMFTYAGAVFTKQLDAQGRADFLLDCFAGDSEPVTIQFEDSTKIVRRPVVADLRDFSKVAIVWNAPVDLDLHAFEYAGAFGEPGHVWAGRPNSMSEADAAAQRDGRGHGFLSTTGIGGESGSNVEVYTFAHRKGQPNGIVKLAVDYKTRGNRPAGEFCDTGPFAELRFTAFIQERDSPPRRLDLVFAAVPCGTEISASARFNSRLISDLAIRG